MAEGENIAAPDKTFRGIKLFLARICRIESGVFVLSGYILYRQPRLGLG